MKALGKRKSNRDGTLLPVLSGGMSQAAVNKCVSNSGKEREREEKKERKRERKGERKRERERDNSVEHDALSLGPADDDPGEYVLTRRKLLNARRRHSFTSKSVSFCCLFVVSASANARSTDDC